MGEIYVAFKRFRSLHNNLCKLFKWVVHITGNDHIPEEHRITIGANTAEFVTERGELG